MFPLPALLSAFGCTELAPTFTEADLRAGDGPAAPTADVSPDIGIEARALLDAGLTYEIYVRSFADSDGDGIGDLDGVVAHLDYLDALGVRTLWLMPVFPAFGPAGYDVTDFDTVTPEYGDAEALAALVADAHGRGMRVLLDLPLNHTHRQHPWFVAAEAGDAAARAHYVYRDQAAADRWYASATEGSYYAYFGADMPDLDWTNPDTRAGMESMFDAWLDAGVDGYRLDAVLMLVEEGDDVEGTQASHALLGELIEGARARREDTFFLAEASEWEVDRAVSWLDRGDAPGADAVLDFPRHDAALEAVESESAVPLLDVLTAEGDAAQHLAAFLGSHDLDRLPNVVADAQARRALRVAQFLLPGAPVLYYGEELDLANATSGTGQDYAMRAPMPWSVGPGAGFTEGTPWFPPDPAFAAGVNVNDEAHDPTSMLSLIHRLMRARSVWHLDEPGAVTWLDENPAVLSFIRDTPVGSLRVDVNLSGGAEAGIPPWGYRWEPVGP